MKYLMLSAALAIFIHAPASASATVEYLSGTLNPGEKVTITGVGSGRGHTFTVNFSKPVDIFFDGAGSYNYYEWDAEGNQITADTYPVYDYGRQHTDTFSRRVDGITVHGRRESGSTWINALRFWTHYDIYNQTSEPVDFTGRVFRYAAVPEPASWALMIGGFALAGLASRRKRSNPSYRALV